jgi:hypothetical protein
MKIRVFFKKKISTSLHRRLVAETQLAGSEFMSQVRENRSRNSTNSNNSNNSNNTQEDWISETKATLTMLNYEPGMI